MKKEKNKKNIYICSLVIFLIGFVLLLLQYILEEKSFKLTTIIILILSTIGSLMITTAIGTLVLSFFDFIEYSKKSIAEVMTNGDFIDLLSEENKIKLKNNL